MQIGTRGRFALAMAAVALLGLASGCEGDKKDSVDAGALDAGPAQPVIGGKLGQAVAAAASASAAPPVGNAGGQGPPEGGVFAPGKSLAALPKDMPYKIEVISDGAEPRTKLAPQLDPKAEQKLTITLGIRMGGPQGLPNIDLDVAFKVDKPKKDKPKAGAEGAPAAPEPQAAAAAGTPVAAKVLSATLASMGLGGPPKELTDELAKLKGSIVRYQLSPTNAASDFQIELAKGADAGLDPIVRALGDAISLLIAPLPDKPVGVNSYWMVTDRAVWPGAQIPVLRYRVFKISKIEGSTVILDLDARQYAEEGTARLPSGGQMVSLSMDQFDSSGKGQLTWDPAALAPRSGEIGQRIQARLMPPGAQANQRVAIQAELNAKIRAPAAPPP